MGMWDDVKRNLMELYEVTSDKTVEVAKVTSLRYDKFGISRDIERQFSELGNLVYTGMKEEREDILANPAIDALRQRLDNLEMELKAKEEEIAAIRDQHRARQHKDQEATPETPPAASVEPMADQQAMDPSLLVQQDAPVQDVEEPLDPGQGE